MPGWNLNLKLYTENRENHEENIDTKYQTSNFWRFHLSVCGVFCVDETPGRQLKAIAAADRILSQRVYEEVGHPVSADVGGYIRWET